jgi:hypothetical protein
MIPLLVAAAAATAVSGIAQFINSEAARNATEEERARLGELVEQLQTPDFDISTINPSSFKVLEKYIPQQAALINEVAPQKITGQGENAKAGNAAQRQALESMLQKAQSGEDPLYEIQAQKALREAGLAANSQRNSLQDQMQRRGIGIGSPMAMALQNQTSASTMDTLANAGLANAANSQNMRSQNMQNAAALGGNLYNQDINMEQQNAGIINAFNQRQAANQQQFLNNQAAVANDASRYNIGTAQDLQNRNVQNLNDAKWRNQANKNQFAQQNFQNQAQKLGLQTNQGNQVINDTRLNTAAQNQAIQGFGDMATNAAAGYGQYQNQQAQTANLQAQTDMYKKKSGQV